MPTILGNHVGIWSLLGSIKKNAVEVSLPLTFIVRLEELIKFIEALIMCA